MDDPILRVRLCIVLRMLSHALLRTLIFCFDESFVASFLFDEFNVGHD